MPPGRGAWQGLRMSAIDIRRAGVADARTIAEVHIASWRETYAEMMPAETLAAFDPAEWASRWRTNLSDPDPASATFFVSDETGVAGLAHCRRQRSEKLVALGYAGEITSLYLLRRVQRRGMGRRLLAEMARHLRKNDCDNASVWVFRDAAHARAFYEARGARATGVAGVWEIYGMVLPDMAYGWDALDLLIEQET